MAEVLPSLGVVAREVEFEREAQLRHTDALPATRLHEALVPGLVLALIAGMCALAVLLPQRFPTWELRDLRDRYLRAEEGFARVHTLDTTIVMVDRMKRQLRRKMLMLRVAIVSLGAAAAALTVGSIVVLGD